LIRRYLSANPEYFLGQVLASGRRRSDTVLFCCDRMTVHTSYSSVPIKGWDAAYR
jgi:hypothetical protein